MKKVILILMFAMASFSMNANTNEVDVKQKQDCKAYAERATEQEFGGYWETMAVLNQTPWIYLNVYNEWKDTCEDLTADGSTLLDPIFL